MRTNNPFLWKLLLWTGAVTVMCAVGPDAAVKGLAQTVPNLAVPATALGFALITATNRDRK